MAFPTRQRGLRSITVKGKAFRWRLKPGVPDSSLTIYGLNSDLPLRVVLLGWKNFWAMFPFYTANAPEIIGPDFIRRAIEFGLENGWNSEERGAAFKIEWEGKEFRIMP